MFTRSELVWEKWIPSLKKKKGKNHLKQAQLSLLYIDGHAAAVTRLTFPTSLQGPPNVQSPAAWSAMARLNVWNQSSLSPTELKAETVKQSQLIIML